METTLHSLVSDIMPADCKQPQIIWPAGFYTKGVSVFWKARIYLSCSVLKLSNLFVGTCCVPQTMSSLIICTVALCKKHSWIQGSICWSRNEQVCKCVWGRQGPAPPPCGSRLWTPAAEIRHPFPMALAKAEHWGGPCWCFWSVCGMMVASALKANAGLCGSYCLCKWSTNCRLAWLPI